ncbi:MAG TPA: hypothetical protein VG986_23480 [Pseudolabrys sp.]|nr:hypothetical protein [Pseudolabrys sp.]
MISRLFKSGSWHDVILLLLPVMVVTLLLTIVTGAVALILNGDPSADKIADVADVSAWLFAAAFFTAAVLAVLQERK